VHKPVGPDGSFRKNVPRDHPSEYCVMAKAFLKLMQSVQSQFVIQREKENICMHWDGLCVSSL